MSEISGVQIEIVSVRALADDIQREWRANDGVSEVRSALLAVAGREGAVLTGLSASLRASLGELGVLGRAGGLTARGVALRAILKDRALDDAFGAL